jgi:hypothetical protein
VVDSGSNKGEARVKGRPTKYTAKLAKEICERLAGGESLRSICRDELMPTRQTVINWSIDEGHEFFDQYARARLIQYHLLADDLIDIADDGSNDWMLREGKNGETLGWVVNGEAVQRSKARLDTRKWMLSKMLPKVYGDKASVDLTTGGQSVAPTVVIAGLETLSPDQLSTLVE